MFTYCESVTTAERLEEEATDERFRLVVDVAQSCYAFANALHATAELVAAEFGLTQAQSKLLWQLDLAHDPLPMRGIAIVIKCDPSNVTGLVDRLEERGLVTRTMSDRDRRIKLISITPKGAELRRQLERAVVERTPWATMSDSELRQTMRFMSKVLATWDRDAAPRKASV